MNQSCIEKLKTQCSWHNKLYEPKHLVCVSGLLIKINPYNSCCYHCVMLTRQCTCSIFM